MTEYFSSSLVPSDVIDLVSNLEPVLTLKGVTSDTSNVSTKGIYNVLTQIIHP